MGQEHQHPHGEAVQQNRRPKDARVIARLNARLDEKATLVRRLEDSVVFYEALKDDYEEEIESLKIQVSALQAAVDQVVVENRILRNRLDLPEAGALELTDEEAEKAPAEMVREEVVDSPSDELGK